MKPNVDLIDDSWVKKHNPCLEAIAWWDKEPDPLKILRNLIDEKKCNWANWFIVRIMNYKDYVRYAVFAAERTIGNFEKLYPDDDRPRKAIEATKRCIENPTPENKSAADSAADSADSAARSAANSAAYSAYSADSAANSAADSAYSTTFTKILKYGYNLLFNSNELNNR